MLVARQTLVYLRHFGVMQRLGCVDLHKWVNTVAGRSGGFPGWVDDTNRGQNYVLPRPASDAAAGQLIDDLRVYAGELVLNPSWVFEEKMFDAFRALAIAILRREGAGRVA